MGSAMVQCSNCDAQLRIEFEFDLTSSDERNMGAENMYTAEGEILCDKCKREISYEFYVSEYPEGTVNDTGISISGAKMLDVHYQDPF